MYKGYNIAHLADVFDELSKPSRHFSGRGIKRVNSIANYLTHVKIGDDDYVHILNHPDIPAIIDKQSTNAYLSNDTLVLTFSKCDIKVFGKSVSVRANDSVTVELDTSVLKQTGYKLTGVDVINGAIFLKMENSKHSERIDLL